MNFTLELIQLAKILQIFQEFYWIYIKMGCLVVSYGSDGLIEIEILDEESEEFQRLSGAFFEGAIAQLATSCGVRSVAIFGQVSTLESRESRLERDKTTRVSRRPLG